ncbi:MotA/TolQ/ExbB proton channel family protein [Chitinophaga pendula]|uniref:MotA/TolQ/ExbB proton channel family protein n=1 Tax=Chitinophaga TaxID=79328 RepID=UPI0012FE3D18|nr:MULTISPECIES: MotA/TolQ/ExbB proton channel family protein [Chitinophaga]UCJ09788.1 MotA/TolQ/ExbB proton channel family protein [Chitinophaga pendula]
MLDTILYGLSSLFFFPVIAVLLFLLVKIFYSLGLFCKEYWRRSRNEGYFTAPYIAALKTVEVPGREEAELALQRILHQAEQSAERSIREAKYSIKMGPTLGLIGTLTPMARALSGLSQGDMAGLSNQMITAFSTTVLGLVIGGIAFTIMHVRLRWQRNDLFTLSGQAEKIYNSYHTALKHKI